VTAVRVTSMGVVLKGSSGHHVKVNSQWRRYNPLDVVQSWW